MRYKEPILLVDCSGFAELVLNESSGKGATTFRGKFQEANKPNKNKREYTYEILEGNRKKLGEAIEARGLYGELDHASDSIIHLSNASHIITNLWWENDVMMGEGEVLPTPSGKVLQAILEAGGRVGMSSRGVGNGTMNSDGILVIGESYKLITFDVVADPSTFNAFQQIVKSKKEHYEPRVCHHHAIAEQDEDVVVPSSSSPTLKKKRQDSNKIDANLFIGYFGQLLEQKRREILVGKDRRI